MSDLNSARGHRMATHKTRAEQKNDIENAKNRQQARYVRELQSHNGDPAINRQHQLNSRANVSTRAAAKASTTASPRQHPLKRAAEANKGRGGDRSAGSPKKRNTNGRGAGKAPATQPPAVEPAPNAGVPGPAQEDGREDVGQQASNEVKQQQAPRPTRKTPKACVTAKEDWAVEDEQAQAQTTNNHTAPPPPPSIFGPSTHSPATVQRSMRNMQPLQLADVPAAPGSLANSVRRTKEGRKWNKKSEQKQHDVWKTNLDRAKTPDF